MGNCIHNQSTTEWAAKDWTSPAPEFLSTDYPHKPAADGDGGGVSTEIKIKITKKQLEELLGRTEVQGLTVQQVISHLIKVSHGFESNQRSWRPALQSIPETTDDDYL